MANYFGDTAFATEEQREIARQVLTLLLAGDAVGAATMLDAHAKPGDGTIKAFARTAMALRGSLNKAADGMADLISVTAGTVRTIEAPKIPETPKIEAPAPTPKTDKTGTEADAHPSKAAKRTRKPAAKAS